MKTKKYNEKFKVLKADRNLGIKIGSLLIMAMGIFSLSAQEATMRVTTSYDTVYLGNPIQVSYEYINLECGHTDPAWPDSWVSSGGANTSMQTSIVNGQSTSKKTLRFMFTPQETGLFTIDIPACNEITVDPLEVIVVDNPEEITQQIPRSAQRSIWPEMDFFDQNPSSPAPDIQKKDVEPIKPKRKTYKL